MTAPTDLLVDCARAAQAAPHGKRCAVYAQYCRTLGWLRGDGTANVQRLLRALNDAGLGGNADRRARRDAGQHALPRLEAEEIVRWQRANARAHGKNLVCMEDAVAQLRGSGIIKAEKIDPATGEVTQLSTHAIHAAIKTYGLHASVLNRAPPAQEQKVEHANQIWQIDASLCVLYYLPAEGGLRVMEEKEFNTNKPKNIAKIEQERVWRYAVVDKASHAIYVEYVFGGESGANLIGVFINAMQERVGEFWGVPLGVYVDPGAAMTGGLFKGFCQQLAIKLMWHLPGNARATGSVEKSQDIIERKFESTLAARPVYSLAELNQRATAWRVRYNWTAVHSRHGLTRMACWLQHIAAHLVQPPSAAMCRTLAATVPKQHRVTQYLTVEFKGQDWCVKELPDVYVGMPVHVCTNPWETGSLRVIEREVDGLPVYFLAPLKVLDALGYFADSPVLGQAHKRPAMTAPERVLQRLGERNDADQAAMAQRTGDVAKTRKAIPFGVRVDPNLPLEAAYMPAMLPRKADVVLDTSAHMLNAPKSTLSLSEACRLIKAALGDAYDAGTYGYLAKRYADGRVPADAADALATNVGHGLQATGTHDGAPVLTGLTGLRSVK